MRFHVRAEGGDALMKLAKYDIRSIATENLRFSCLCAAHLVCIAQHKLAGLQRRLVGIGSGNTTAFDRRMADPVPEPKRLCLSGKRVTILTPNRRYPRHRTIGFARAVESSLKSFRVWRNRHQHHMKIRTAQRLFPCVRMALAGVAQILVTGRHALTKFPGEAVQRFLWNAERLQTLI